MKRRDGILKSLEGNWKVRLKDGSSYTVKLPGTLDENNVGYKDTGANQWHPDASLGNGGEMFDEKAPIATRFTRKHTYEGPAVFYRSIHYLPPAGRRIFLEAERSRCLRLRINGREVAPFRETSISTPYIFEVTGLLQGESPVELIADNSYPGLPHDDLVYSSAATDETQTNWNGILGYLRLREELPVFFSGIRVYPHGETITVLAELSASEDWSGRIKLESPALMEPVEKEISVGMGTVCVPFPDLPLREQVRRWDLEEGCLCELCGTLSNGERKSVSFGVRDFGDDGNGRLAVNGRTIFLRSEANCAVFPEEGHPPMTVEAWKSILQKYRSYGVNCMRFHSHCPPEAAFTAADQMGMLMQPELSHWNPRDAFVSEESFAYYKKELRQILLQLANHPSFVMMTLGNELWTDAKGHERMDQMLDMARRIDDTRLYANGSNVEYGTAGCDAGSDFYTSQKFYEYDLRGTFAACGDHVDKIQGFINQEYPGANRNYDRTMDQIRNVYAGPVFSFEVGQFEVLPDFDELEEFSGVTDPVNLKIIRDKVREQGLESQWKRWVEATGELALIGYREETEAALRTGKLSGISLLGLQDFPGQGTALVGMMNAHLEPKPFAFARPERFRSFFRDQLPLVKLPRYTYETGDVLKAPVAVANFGKSPLYGPLRWTLKGEGYKREGEIPWECCEPGTLTDLGEWEIRLDGLEKPCRLDLTVSLSGSENQYPLWVYPPCKPVCPGEIYETQVLDAEAAAVLEKGGRVYLAPPSAKEHLPASIGTQFTTDFWSVGTFPAQEGSMGQLIQEDHPLFRRFPTEFHTNWQWWPMASSRAVILPRRMRTIVGEMDSYAYMRPMAQMFECRCGKGSVLFSSMGLQELQQYPEARALLNAVYHYMVSEEFRPVQEMSLEEIRGLIK